MFKNLKKSKSEGFTIIEVMIVLAIAGLILLIVFLAVPALQRNSRNTQRKSDVGRELSAATDVLNSNNGSIASITTASITNSAGTLAFYAAGPTVTAMAAGVAAGSGLNATTTDTTTLYTGAVCDANTGTAITGSTRSIAMVYTLEPSTKQCQSS